MAEKLGEAYVELRASTKKFQAGLKDAQNRTMKATTGMQKNLNSLNMIKARKAVDRFKKSIFGLRGAMVALATGAAAKSIIQLGMNFDRSMNIVKVVSGATAKEFDGLTASAKAMGEATEFTASQAADALKFLSMAGLTATQSMKALPQMLDLATAGQIDLARAADISTNVMTMMGLSVEELTKVNDAFVAVQASANTNIEELAQAFIFAGPKAKAFGLSVNDLSALIGLLANAGIKATMAGTTLRQSMIRLIDPPKEAAEILKKYNIVVTDSEGKLNNYIDVLGQLSDAQLNATEITKLFGARAGNIQVILDQGRGVWQQYIDQINDVEGVSKTAAATIRDDMRGAFDKLRATIESVGLKIWDDYREKVKQTTLDIAGWLRGHREDIKNTIGSIGSAVETLFTTSRRLIDSLPGGGMEWGIIGYLLFKGMGTAALILTTLVTVNAFMKGYGMDVGSLIEKYKELDRLMQDWWEMGTGQRRSPGEGGGYVVRGQITATQKAERVLREYQRIQKEVLVLSKKLWSEEIKNKVKGITDELVKEEKALKSIEKVKTKLLEKEKLILSLKVIDIAEALDREVKKTEHLLETEKTLARWRVDTLVERLAKEEEAGESLAKLRVQELADSLLVESKKREAFIESAQAGDDFISGMQAGLMELQDNFRTWGEMGYDVVEAFASSSYNIMSDVFFDAVKGDLNSFSDYWERFTDNMLRVFTDMLAEMATAWAVSKIAGFFGINLPGGGGGGGIGGTAANTAVGVGVKAGLGKIGAALGIGGGAVAGSGAAALGFAGAGGAGGATMSTAGLMSIAQGGAGAGAGSGLAAGAGGIGLSALALAAPLALAWAFGAFDKKKPMPLGWEKGFKENTMPQFKVGDFAINKDTGRIVRYGGEELHGGELVGQIIPKELLANARWQQVSGTADALSLGVDRFQMNPATVKGVEEYISDLVKTTKVYDEYLRFTGGRTNDPEDLSFEAFSGRRMSGDRIPGFPDFHEGGISSEDQTANLQKGEGVFTPEQMEAMGGESVIHVHVSIDGREIGSAVTRQIRNRDYELIDALQTVQ